MNHVLTKVLDHLTTSSRYIQMNDVTSEERDKFPINNHIIQLYIKTSSVRFHYRQIAPVRVFGISYVKMCQSTFVIVK